MDPHSISQEFSVQMTVSQSTSVDQEVFLQCISLVLCQVRRFRTSIDGLFEWTINCCSPELGDLFVNETNKRRHSLHMHFCIRFKSVDETFLAVFFDEIGVETSV